MMVAVTVQSRSVNCDIAARKDMWSAAAIREEMQGYAKLVKVAVPALDPGRHMASVNELTEGLFKG